MGHNNIPSSFVVCGSTALNWDAIEYNDNNSNGIPEPAEVRYPDRALSADEFVCFQKIASQFVRSASASPTVIVSGSAAKDFPDLKTSLEGMARSYSNYFNNGGLFIQVTITYDNSSYGEKGYNYNYNISGQLRNGEPFSQNGTQGLPHSLGYTAGELYKDVSNSLNKAKSSPEKTAK